MDYANPRASAPNPPHIAADYYIPVMCIRGRVCVPETDQAPVYLFT